MRKFLIVVLAIMLHTIVAAQDYSREYNVSYGAYAASTIYHAFVYETFTDSDPDRSVGNDWALGPLSFEYYRRVSRLWSLGAIGVNSNLFYDVFYNREKRYGVQSVHLTGLAAAKLHWLNKDHFTMYSKAAVGISFNSVRPYDMPFVLPNFQLSLLGMEYLFSSRHGIFVEFGAGEQGIFHGGISYKM